VGAKYFYFATIAQFYVSVNFRGEALWSDCTALARLIMMCSKE